MTPPSLSAFMQDKIYLPFLRHMAYRFTVLKKPATRPCCFVVRMVFSLYIRSPHTSMDGMTFYIESLGCCRLKKIWSEHAPQMHMPETSSGLQMIYGKVIDVSRR